MTDSGGRFGRAARRRWRAALAVCCAALLCGSCLPESPVRSNRGGARALTVYAFSVMKEPLEKAVFPGFAAEWKREHGEDVKFTASFAGSETITNQILQGVAADVGIFSIERDLERLAEGGAVTANWRTLPFKGIVNKTPFIILVRKASATSRTSGGRASASSTPTRSARAARSGRCSPSTARRWRSRRPRRAGWTRRAPSRR
jgi:ABC-type sulfate transport system substrate-binding protein